MLGGVEIERTFLEEDLGESGTVGVGGAGSGRAGEGGSEPLDVVGDGFSLGAFLRGNIRSENRVILHQSTSKLYAEML